MYSLRTKRSIDGFDLYFLIFFALVGLAGGAIMANVDNAAHIAGFIGGCVISLFFKIKAKEN
ncbi:MAG: rhomboid family intramembrane serine protease, partial [Firmicutes bacterium]|nr:rhomboid family intramembrane serine protease [Bacillota bacterium]